jgi:hypothetical protein
MIGFWDRIFGLDYELSIWVEEDDLGREKLICHKNKSYFVKIPKEIDKKITLRLSGLGKTRTNKTGDLFLHVWLNKGEDVQKNLWLSETSARDGAEKMLSIDGKRIIMVVPPRSYYGLAIRLRGLGEETIFDRCAPLLRDKVRGNLLVKLFVYPDRVTPQYGIFDNLSTEDMALEGWVYKKFDEVIHRLGRSSLPSHPIQADAIANLFNEFGCKGIFDALVDHLDLTNLRIELAKSASLALPGSCQKTAEVKNNTVVGYRYRITIKEQFLDNPFSTAAIIAHELCHIVYSEKIDYAIRLVGLEYKTHKASLEEERTVDLLVFMFMLGEFQLRVARDKRLTLGYFNQELFERIQVIVSRKLN